MTRTAQHRFRPAVAIGSVVVALLFGGFVSALASAEPSVRAASSPVPVPDIRLDGCATTDFSVLETGEVNTNFIYEFNILQMSALGPAGTDVNFNIDIADPACQVIPIVKMKIDEAIHILEDGLVTECPRVQAYIEAGATTNERGEPINLEAGQDFLDQWCTGLVSPPGT